MAHVKDEIAQVLASEGARFAVLFVDDHFDIPVDAGAEQQDNPAVRLVKMIGSHHGYEAVARVGQIDTVTGQRPPQQLVKKARRCRDVHLHTCLHCGTLSQAPSDARPRIR